MRDALLDPIRLAARPHRAHTSPQFDDLDGLDGPYDEAIRVPFRLMVPGAVEMRIPAIAGNVDVAPTLLALAGDTASRSFDGRSLLPLLAEPAAPWAQAASARELHTRLLRLPRHALEIRSLRLRRGGALQDWPRPFRASLAASFEGSGAQADARTGLPVGLPAAGAGERRRADGPVALWEPRQQDSGTQGPKVGLGSALEAGA
jgi:hypothetical protein